LQREVGSRGALLRQKNVETTGGLGLEAEELLAERPRFPKLLSGMLKLEDGPRQENAP
jgi:hypothetical protein